MVIKKTGGLLAAFAAALQLNSAPALADHPTTYSKLTSPGGLTFYHRFDEITPYATATFGWPVVSDGRGREGARAMLGSLLFNGVYPRKPSDFFERLADYHASASLAQSETAFTAEAKAPAKELGTVLNLVTRAIRTGEPNAKTFKRTKTNFINSEVQSATRAETQVYRSGAVMMLGDHRIVRGFDPQRFEKTSLADIATWRKTAFNEGPLEIVVSGRMTADAAGQMIDKAFAGWPKTAAKDKPKADLVAAKPARIAVAISGKQSVIHLQAPTATISGREGQIASIAHAILGSGPSSRLWTAVRGNLGASYGASSSLGSIGPDQRSVTLSASVDPAQTEASIAAMRRAYTDWYEKGITESELKTQRERVLTGVQTSFRDPSAANRLLLPLLLTGRPFDDVNSFETTLAAITLEQVNTFIKDKFPKPDDLMLVVGTPEGTTLASACAVKSWQEVAKSCAK